MKCTTTITIVLLSFLFIVSNCFSQNDKSLGLSKYNFKSINGVELSTDPVMEKSFRNGNPIKEPRTPGEWDEFIKKKKTKI